MTIFNFLKVGFLAAAITLVFMPASPSNASVAKGNYNLEKTTINSHNTIGSNITASRIEKKLTNTLPSTTAIGQNIEGYKVSIYMRGRSRRRRSRSRIRTRTRTRSCNGCRRRRRRR